MSKFVEVNFVRATLFRVLVVETIFISLFSFASVLFLLISSHVTTESSPIRPTYLPFLQLRGAGFQIYIFLRARFSFGFFHSHRHLIVIPYLIPVTFFTIKLT